MTCLYCGREIEEGKQFCECGHPVMANGYTPAAQPMYTPAPMKRSSPGVPKFVWVLLAVLIIAGGGYFLKHYMDSRNLRDESTWEEISESEYTVTLPKALKKADSKKYTPGYKVIGFYTSTEAAFEVDKMDLDASEKAAFKNQDRQQLLKQLISAMSIDGQKLEPKELGDGKVYVEYTRSEKDVIKKSDKLFVVDVMCMTEDAIYEAYAYCAEEDKDKYDSAMIKWVESFKVKE